MTIPFGGLENDAEDREILIDCICTSINVGLDELVREFGNIFFVCCCMDCTLS